MKQPSRFNTTLDGILRDNDPRSIVPEPELTVGSIQPTAVTYIGNIISERGIFIDGLIEDYSSVSKLVNHEKTISFMVSLVNIWVYLPSINESRSS